MKFFLVALTSFSLLFANDDCSCLFRDLALVDAINREINDRLPFFYNYAYMGGYFNTPSARFPNYGDIALGVSSVPPYTIYGANFAPFTRIELSANYRVFRGVEESNFGREGFGDDAERIGNVKFGILVPEDGFSYLPSIAFGLDDFVGTKRFSSRYFVATKMWKAHNFELTVGYGWGRLKGFFGGAAWTPFRQTCLPILKNISLIAEYDANDYKKHKTEHFKGRSVKSRFNGGISYILGDTLQLSLSSVRGKKVGGSATLRFPLGTTNGLFPKVDDPPCYASPVDVEPLGPIRKEREFVCDLACSLSDQGLDLYDAYLLYDCVLGNQLYLTVVNNRYRQERCLRERIQDLLAALSPSNIASIKVVVEADGVKSHSYCYRACDLAGFRECCVTNWELDTLAPMAEVGCFPNPYEAAHLFERRRNIWTFTARPRLISFFGATTGKYKYSLGLVATFQGFIPGGITYRAQGAYSALSSMHGLESKDRLNPSQIIHVRTDMVKYFQGGKVRLEELYLQRSWNLGEGFFARLAAGYFEPAYGGGAGEVLFYLVQSNWAFGIDAAVVWKREFNGLGFKQTITRFDSNHQEVKERFTGVQAFFNLIYDFKPLNLLFRIKAGQFLAKDRGARFEVTRVFPSGARFSLWVTVTNGGDKVNGRTYYDKGFAFTFPFDIFLKQSSRTFLTNSMSAWLRDVGAIAETGTRLYPTLYEERHD